MHKVLFALMLVAGLAYGQSYDITPFLSTKSIDSCVCTVGSDTVYNAQESFDDVTVGDAVFGTGIPYGTTVLAKLGENEDSAIVLSKAATIGDQKILAFGYSVPTTYASGDWLGQTFLVYSNPGVGGVAMLQSIVIDDKIDGIGNTDIAFFSTWSDTLGRDSVAANIPAAEVLKFCGYVSLTTATDLGGGRILEANNIQLGLPKNLLYARLVAKAAYGPTTSVAPLKVRLTFK